MKKLALLFAFVVTACSYEIPEETAYPLFDSPDSGVAISEAEPDASEATHKVVASLGTIVWETTKTSGEVSSFWWVLEDSFVFMWNGDFCEVPTWFGGRYVASTAECGFFDLTIHEGKTFGTPKLSGTLWDRCDSEPCDPRRVVLSFHENQ